MAVIVRGALVVLLLLAGMVLGAVVGGFGYWALLGG
jgi:hypothetical protein